MRLGWFRATSRGYCWTQLDASAVVLGACSTEHPSSWAVTAWTDALAVDDPDDRSGVVLGILAKESQGRLTIIVVQLPTAKSVKCFANSHPTGRSAEPMIDHGRSRAS